METLNTEQKQEEPGEAGRLESSNSGKEAAMIKVMQPERYPTILGLITKNLSVPDLWSLRSICPQWNAACIDKLLDKDGVMELQCAGETEHVLGGYTELMGSCVGGRIPVNSYRLLNIFRENVVETDLDNFFRLCGHSLRHLDLRQNSAHQILGLASSFQKIGLMRTIIFKECPNLAHIRFTLEKGDLVQPGGGEMGQDADGNQGKLLFTLPLPPPADLSLLRQLEIADGHFSDDSHELANLALSDLPPLLRNLLRDLFRYAINLESLSLGKNDGMVNVAVLTALQDHALPSGLAKIKCLEIYKLDVPHLRILLDLANREENALRLETLFFSIRYANAGGEKLRDLFQLLPAFLSTQAATLRCLRIQVDETQPYTPLPSLPGVRTFGVQQDGGKQFRLPRPLAEIFPALRSFEYASMFDYPSKGAGENSWFRFDARHEGVDRLSLNIGIMAGWQFAETFGHQFKSLTRLEVEILDIFSEIFPKLLVMAPGLESVHIKYQGFRVLDLDCLFSGVSRDRVGELQKILDEKLEAGGEMTRLETLENLLVYRTKPGLGNLPRLKNFVLVCPETHYELTDFGGHFGLALASISLQHFEIRAHASRHAQRGRGLMLSDGCKAALRSSHAPANVFYFTSQPNVNK